MQIRRCLFHCILLDRYFIKSALDAGICIHFISTSHYVILLTLVPQAANEDVNLCGSQERANKVAALLCFFLRDQRGSWI